MMMKRAVSFVLLGLGLAALGGCPIYSDENAHRVCVGADCYDCPDSYYSSTCASWACSSSYDCPSGYDCSSDHRCHPGDGTTSPSGGGTCSKPSDCPSGTTCGANNRCQAGDCGTTGCPSNYVCTLASGSSGKPVCVPTRDSACTTDADCTTPTGSKCLSGACVAPADQCADATQCAGNSQCVDGSCTPSCSANKPCPTGYSCDAAKGVCTGNSSACTDSSQCTGGTVCAQQHCVTPCTNGACSAGLVCVDGGCVADEKPRFVCSDDGVQDACQAGSICLRHSCYIACDSTAPDACKSADTFNVCKTVTTSSGSHSVCGSSTNLGTECDPTQAKACTSPLICIDGFCR